VKDDDLVYGARSGIQKAVRRGDLDLCRTCFDLLWEEKAHRAWLKWRTPVLIAEEAYYFAGEAAPLIQEKSHDEGAWRKLLYRLTLIPKNKDACGLWDLAGGAAELTSEQEALLSRQLTHELTQAREVMKESDPAVAARKLFDGIKKAAVKNGVTKYELDGMKVLTDRASAGGMIGDRWILAMAVLLLASRPCSPRIIKKKVRWGIDHWASAHGRSTPIIKSLPWYVFDMHTQVGKIVMSVFLKHHREKFRIKDREELSNVWFLLESGFVPDELQEEASIDDEAVGCSQSALLRLSWDYSLKKNLSGWSGVDKFLEDGWPGMRRELQELVRWCLERRESE